MATRIRSIALDPGFGGFKAAEVQGDAIRVVTVPSVVGTGSTDLGMLDLAGVTGRRRRSDQPHHVVFEGTEYCPSKRRTIACSAAGRFVKATVVEEQVAKLVKLLRLPDDWRDRLVELAGEQEDRGEVERKRRYLQDKLRRLRNLYLEGDLEKAEYNRRKVELQMQLSALREPGQPEIEQAGETLESLGMEWVGAPLQYQREMLQVIFESIHVDTLAGKVICVKPYTPFVPLFRMDGLEEREDGYFYDGEKAEAGSQG